MAVVNIERANKPIWLARRSTGFISEDFRFASAAIKVNYNVNSRLGHQSYRRIIINVNMIIKWYIKSN